MSSMHVYADDGNNAVVDDTTIIVPTTCSMSGTINEGNEHTATILPGSYKDNIGKTDIKALCNDYNGFSIYAIGYSNNTSGTPSEGNNTMIGQTTGSTIATGTNDSGDTSNWAMKITPATGVTIQNGYDSFKAVPGTPAVIAEGTGSVSDAFTMTYQVWISATQEADSYTGRVTYTLTSPNA